MNKRDLRNLVANGENSGVEFKRLLLKWVPAETWRRVDRPHFLARRGEGEPIALGRSEEPPRRAHEYRLIDDTQLLLTIYAAGHSHV